MYLEYFQLKSRPFQVGPEANAYFTGDARRALVKSLLNVLEHEQGIVTLIGEIGAGKTTACRHLLKRMPAKWLPVYVADPTLTRDQLLAVLADAVGVADARIDRADFVIELQRRLRRLAADGRRVVLLIDEAHAMPEDTLDTVRLLSQTFETDIRVVLIGPPELDQLLGAESMRALRDRISQTFKVAPLTRDEVDGYLRFRLRAAGYQGPVLFGQAAVALLYQHSKGLPRRINVLADKALLSSAIDQRGQVSEKDVLAALADIRFEPPLNRRRERFGIGVAAFAAGSFVGAALVAAALSLGWLPNLNPAAPTASAPGSAEVR